MTWSTFSAGRVQYWHEWSSRKKIALRFSGTRRARGTLTYVRNRTTDGDEIVIRSECHTMPFDSTTAARSRITNTMARRVDTTDSGS
jgi:hypothetical protein